MAPFDFATLPRIRHNVPVNVGDDFTAHRLDGRVFAGAVVKVAAINGDTLVTIVRQDGSHRSVYLKDTTGWSVRS